MKGIIAGSTPTYEINGTGEGNVLVETAVGDIKVEGELHILSHADLKKHAFPKSCKSS